MLRLSVQDIDIEAGLRSGDLDIERLCRWRQGNAGRQGKRKCHKCEEAFESVWSYETMNIAHAFLLGCAGANIGIAASPVVRIKLALAPVGPASAIV
jgi:hypothetical protein